MRVAGDEAKLRSCVALIGPSFINNLGAIVASVAKGHVGPSDYSGNCALMRKKLRSMAGTSNSLRVYSPLSSTPD